MIQRALGSSDILQDLVVDRHFASALEGLCRIVADFVRSTWRMRDIELFLPELNGVVFEATWKAIHEMAHHAIVRERIGAIRFGLSSGDLLTQVLVATEIFSTFLCGVCRA